MQQSFEKGNIIMGTQYCHNLVAILFKMWAFGLEVGFICLALTTANYNKSSTVITA
jgi:hypothetical protein